MTPRDVDRLSLRDLAVMLPAAGERQRQALQGGALAAAAVYNWGGPRSERFVPRSPAELFPEVFGAVEREDPEEAAEMRRRHRERLKGERNGCRAAGD